MGWGVKYEDVAVTVYERRHNLHVAEFGCLPHPTLKCFGASPDGIIDKGPPEYIGRMLEIKVPPKRVIDPEVVPKHYFYQMQGQLEVCNLDECEFLQVKIHEYNSTDAYKEDKHPDGYCLPCCIHLCPDIDVSRNFKTKIFSNFETGSY